MKMSNNKKNNKQVKFVFLKKGGESGIEYLCDPTQVNDAAIMFALIDHLSGDNVRDDIFPDIVCKKRLARIEQGGVTMKLNVLAKNVKTMLEKTEPKIVEGESTYMIPKLTNGDMKKIIKERIGNLDVQDVVKCTFTLTEIANDALSEKHLNKYKKQLEQLIDDQKAKLKKAKKKGKKKDIKKAEKELEKLKKELKATKNSLKDIAGSDKKNKKKDKKKDKKSKGKKDKKKKGKGKKKSKKDKSLVVGGDFISTLEYQISKCGKNDKKKKKKLQKQLKDAKKALKDHKKFSQKQQKEIDKVRKQGQKACRDHFKNFK